MATQKLDGGKRLRKKKTPGRAAATFVPTEGVLPSDVHSIVVQTNANGSKAPTVCITGGKFHRSGVETKPAKSWTTFNHPNATATPRQPSVPVNPLQYNGPSKPSASAAVAALTPKSDNTGGTAQAPSGSGTSVGLATKIPKKFKKPKRSKQCNTSEALTPLRVQVLRLVNLGMPNGSAGQKKSFISHTSPDFLTLRDLPLVVHAHPKLPLGHHFIQLDRELDAKVLTAYMALISRKTICVLPQNASLSSYAEIFRTITSFNILCPDKNSMVYPRAPKALFRNLRSSPCPTMLLIQKIPSYDWLKIASPDCIVHWGIPKDPVDHAIQVRACPPVRSCFMFYPGRTIDVFQRRQLVDHGITEYSKTVMGVCFGPRSPFQAIRRVAAQQSASNDPVTGDSYTTRPGFGHKASPVMCKKVGSPPTPRKTNQSISKIGVPANISRAPQINSANAMDGYATHSGHFYIVLKDMNHAIALISYIALCSKKIICVPPANRNFEKVQKLLEHCTGLSVTICTSHEGQGIRDTAQKFTQQSSGILLRPAHCCYRLTRWLQPNCLVYWGIPPGARRHAYKCLDRISLSYVILTSAQYDQMLAEEPIWRWYIKRHPLSDQFNNPFQSSPLHNLRSKLSARLTSVNTLDPFFTAHRQLLSIKPHEFFSDSQLLPWSNTNGWESNPPSHGPPKPNTDSWGEMSYNELSDLRGLLRTYPKLPAGSKYIRLDRDSDLVAFTACMALQSEKTICIVGEHVRLDLYAKIFELVTEADVLYFKEPEEDDSSENLFEVFRLRTSPTMLLLPGPVPNAALKSANPDCVLHWGFPSNFGCYLKQITLMEPTARSCLVLFSGEETEKLRRRYRLDNSVARYSKPLVKNYLGPDSPFREVRALAFQALSKILASSPSALNNKSYDLGGFVAENHGNEKPEKECWRHTESRIDDEWSRSSRASRKWGRARAHVVEQELLEASEEKQVQARKSKETRQWVNNHTIEFPEAFEARSRRKRRVTSGAWTGRNTGGPTCQPEDLQSLYYL